MITLNAKIPYEFKEKSLITRAFTHKSYFNEQEDKSLGHNERLEFLGDAVLDLTLSHMLMEFFPDLEEGDLSRLRASLVNESAFAELAIKLNLTDHILLGKGELASGGKEKPRLLASTFEALIGAIYLDGGFDQADTLLRNLYTEIIKNLDIENQYAGDFKTRLQEVTQEMFKLTPIYEVINEDGPDHLKNFTVAVSVNGRELARGDGRSKKQAEQAAAKLALEKLI